MERLNNAAFSDENSPSFALRVTDHHCEGENDFDSYPKYPVDVLRNEASHLPDQIDPKMKELHLTHDDFVSIFQMNYMEFASLPKWRKQELKKNKKLF